MPCSMIRLPVTWSSTGAMASSQSWPHGHPAGQRQGPGGGRTTDTNPTAELYDPVSGTFSPTGSLNVTRAFAASTRLATGKVLVSGGTVGI